MDSLKGAFSKGLTTLNVKTNNFMEESKCKTYISTLEKEIQDLKQKIGEETYKAWISETDCQDEVSKCLESIKEKEALIEEQKEIMANLAVAEQKILGKNASQSQTSQAAGTVYCASCGAVCKSGFKFCSKCGKPLS
jgi:predicted metal-binding protein